MANFAYAIPTIFHHEGAFSNDATDAGGATNYGISLRFLKSLGYEGDIDQDGDVDIEDIKNMTIEQASTFYKKHWWDKYNYNAITDQLLATKIFDCAVNMGAKQTHLFLQRACNEVSFKDQINVDGIMGPKTLEMANKLDPTRLIWSIRNQMTIFYRNLVKKNPSYTKYLNGWLKRASE